MPSKKIIEQKIEEILKQLKYLKELVKISKKTFLSDDMQMYFAERVMQRMIEAAIDINMHVIADIKGITPDTYANSFTEMGQKKFFPLKFAESIAKSVGLRNLIVHEYHKIDIQKFHDSMKSALVDYAKYVRYISKIL